MAYDTSDWSELFVASAALAGLVSVAVSINVERILEFPGLPERALSTRSLPEGSPPTPELLGRLFLWAGGTVPFVVGGASLIAETGGGLYWIAAGILLGIVGGVANAWVLLVEIRR
jgi:hypothetical protein